MPHGGALWITTENVAVGADQVEADGIPEGEYAMLSVSDTGVGIDDYTRERLFEPFFTTKEKGRGTGLGLSTVYDIITGSNGYIAVDTRQGGGSQFRIYFPCAKGPSDAVPDEDMPTGARTGSATILVVDDDEHIRRFVESGLSSLGYRVLTAPGGSAGLEICMTESDRIDVILSDVMMSEMSGPRFMTDAVKLRPNAVAIYMSATSQGALSGLRRGSALGDIPLIKKPFDLESLSRLIRECLHKSDRAELSF
jgi:two-component system cell cycle sensor histidine kinase/response regulator CckA